MSIDFTVFSALTPAELQKVEQACRERIDAWYDEHDDGGDDPPVELALGGVVPSPDEAAQMVWLPDDRGPAPADSEQTQAILDRLGTIRSAITIDRPGDFATDPLQVSVVRFLLERSGPGLVRLVDSLELTESVLGNLRSKQGVPGFEDAGGAGDEPDLELDDDLPAAQTPMSKAVRSLIDSLRRDEVLEVEPTFAIEPACDAVLETLEKMQKRGRGGASNVADALLGVPGVVDIYADDAALEQYIQEAMRNV